MCTLYSVHTAHALGKHQHITRINTEHFEPRLTRLRSQEEFTKFEKDGNKRIRGFLKVVVSFLPREIFVN
jgi:hypothetical protein